MKKTNYNKMLADLRDLMDNPSPRVPVALCLDVSASMAGAPIGELNRGVQQFLEEMRQDEQTCHWLGGKQNLIRIHCGLEDVDALIADLEQALANI